MGKITVVGSSNTDMIMQLENIPRPGETLLGNKFSTLLEEKVLTKLLELLEQEEMSILSLQ